jgi:hypothetical protein
MAQNWKACYRFVWLHTSNGGPFNTMRLPPRRVALSFLALLLGALSADAQNPIPATPPQKSPAPTAASSATKSPAKKSKLPPKKARHRRKTRPKAVVPAADPPQKVVVRHGGTSEAQPQIAPVAPQNQDSAERRKAGQLLTATDANLKSLLVRTLTPEQQATVAQARLFMGQARAALDAGDLTQGYNLASKANTLSEELVKK